MTAKSVRPFLFLLFLPSGAGSQRPAAVKGAPLSWRGVSAPLTARTAAKASTREEKALVLKVRDLYSSGGNHDE